MKVIFFVTFQVQNLNINPDFKPGSFDTGFQIFSQGQISFKSGTQILHLGAFDALSRVLGQILDMLNRWAEIEGSTKKEKEIIKKYIAGI